MLAKFDRLLYFMNDVLIEREGLQAALPNVKCFTVAEAPGDETLEVCAPSRKEAHLHMRSMGMQLAGLAASRKNSGCCYNHNR